MAMSGGSDRNLLFGMLAVQLNFLSRDRLFGAFQAWMFEREKPIGQILVERSDLDPGTREVIEALVDRHAARRVAEPEADPDSGREGEASLYSGEDDPDRTRTRVDEGAPPVGGRYRVLRPHARGGLGAIFVAHDAELNREVALKEILERHADDPASRARFQLEAEINGGLEHPGVVPVHGLGWHADGRPYYVMRFIRGDTLKGAIADFHNPPGPLKAGARELAFRQLLRRFLDVCFAVDYAHSRGVLHRDLKPSNVMVGKYGETLVVDWGLAKVVGRPDLPRADGERTLAPNVSGSDAETLPGSTLGTPSYMSPEQAAGDLDRLGPASDVYSLGATLYSLLTGRPPLEGPDVGLILQLAQKGEFPAPRRIDSSIPPALEAVCLKAMALGPDDRYPTARALAEDVERWLADEPVLCRREPRAARFGRWARHHQTLLAGAACGLLVAIVALFVVTKAHEKARVVATQRAQFERDFGFARRALKHLEDLIDQALSQRSPPTPPSLLFLSFAEVPSVAAARQGENEVPAKSQGASTMAPPAPRGPTPVAPGSSPPVDPATLQVLWSLKLVIEKYNMDIDKRRINFDAVHGGGVGFARNVGGFGDGNAAPPGIIGD